MKGTLQLKILLLLCYGIIGPLCASLAGTLCEVNSGENGTCSLVKDCPYAKMLINKRKRPVVCEYVGNEPIVCCPSKTATLKMDFSKFKRSECQMITLGGIYEPPGMTDHPTSKQRNKIIDYDGLPPQSPPPLPQTLPTLESLSAPAITLPPLNLTLESLSSLPHPPPSPSTSPITLPTLESLPPLPPRPLSPLPRDHTAGTSDEHDIPPPAIVGGIRADTAEFPHMARLGIGQNISSISWFCGGSLISDKFILTAAHCIYSQYGEVNWARLGDPVEMRYEELHEVVNNTIHPEYTPFQHYHDIALCELANKVNFNFYISPACVHTEMEIPDTIRITVSGWGATGFGEEGSDDLLKADLDMYSFEECTKRYPKTLRKLPRGLDNETQICAGGRKEVKDTCQGDSGGPIQMRGVNQTFSMIYSIFGVTSFGKICGFVNQPGVYVRIYPYLSWIDRIVWKAD